LRERSERAQHEAQARIAFEGRKKNKKSCRNKSGSGRGKGKRSTKNERGPSIRSLNNGSK
jgi:hypothetical protein